MTTTAPTSPPPLAIVGVSALFPGSSTATGLWSDICTGTDRLGPVPASHWLTEDYYDPDPSAPDKTYANRGGFIDPIDFDPVAWGIPPKLLRSTDTTQLLALIAAEQVLQDAARGRFATMDRSRVSVILGVTSAQELIAPMISRLQRPVWVKALRDHGVPEDDVQAICDRISDHYVPWEESSFPGLLGNVVAGRVANRLDLGGANCVIDAACASTLAALNMGMQELWQGDSELVIAGGADTLNDIFMFMCFSKTPALSPTGDCRPFSADADGTMLGEGLGMVALRRLADAERDGDKIYAVVRGLGSSSDGRGNSVYAPSSAGQAQALRRAYAQAGFDPRTIELVEAHGTGTKAGDAAEVGGLKLAFETDDGETTARPWCALGSIKAQVGHTKAAAGAAGLIKAALALHHKVLPPTIKVDRPNPKLGLEGSPLYLNTEARPWIRDSRHPRRAGVSAFGFGGSNFHVALEEYTGPGDRAERLRVDAAELVVVRGDTAAEVTAQARQWASRCDEPGIVQWAAWSSHRGSAPSAPVRLAVVASDAEDLRAKLERACTKIDTDPHAAFVAPDGTAYGVGEQAGAVGLLFPGQGSQAVGMTGTLAMRFDVARRAWDQAADLDLGDASPIHEVVFPHPKFSDEDRQADTLRLRQTQWAQPALGAASLAMLAIVRALGIEASAVAGHSFGEVMALHAAGVLEAGDALAVARRRGEIMAEAASAAGQPGSMSAVVASASKAGDILDRAAVQGVVLANHNAPTQTVVSGPTAAIEQAESALQAAGLKVQRLPVATAFHSPLVAHAVEPFAAALESVDFGGAQRPVYSGASATPYEADPGAQRARLAQALAEPVRFD
nr:acyltransferase domain-containing protein [Deltaproteobacteria bacterium]